MTEGRKYQLSKSWTTDGEPIRCSASMKNLRNNTMELVWATQVNIYLFVGLFVTIAVVVCCFCYCCCLSI